MVKLPDPDSHEVGELIDAYLSQQRRSGWTSRKVQIEAQHLGLAAAENWNADSLGTVAAVQRFTMWIQANRP